MSRSLDQPDSIWVESNEHDRSIKRVNQYRQVLNAMAHIHDLAPQVTAHYSSGRKQDGRIKFPDTDVFRGFNAPSRLEGDILDLEVDGVVPPEINGTFYRIQPDHRFPPIFEDDIQFNGDGAVTAIRLHDGHADFRQRFVKTDRYHAETAARKALFGRYRNMYE